MKFRIFGTIFVLAILAVVYIVTQDAGSGNIHVQPVAPSVEPVLQPLKIN